MISSLDALSSISLRGLLSPSKWLSILLCVAWCNWSLTYCVISIIAVTGLAANPYGSWTGKQSRRMWLREFLSQDFKNCRTITFGYDSRLDTPGFGKTEDYALDLLNNMSNFRNSDEVRYTPKSCLRTRLCTNFEVWIRSKNGLSYLLLKAMGESLCLKLVIVTLLHRSRGWQE